MNDILPGYDYKTSAVGKVFWSAIIIQGYIYIPLIISFII